MSENGIQVVDTMHMPAVKSVSPPESKSPPPIVERAPIPEVKSVAATGSIGGSIDVYA